MSSLKNIRPVLSFLLGVSLLLLSACSKADPLGASKHDARAEAKAYYAARPEFFHFKTTADIPANLEWEDGSELPEFAAPEAKRGGTLNYYIPDFPRTLRTVGPDSNGSFRAWILDDNVMYYARRHPNLTDLTKTGFHYYPGIAAKWALDRATKTVYITLDSAARWSDGVPITTDDTLFAFFFYRSTYIKAPWYNNYYTTKFSGITRFDDHTFALHFPELRPDIFALALENEPTPAHFYAEVGEDYPERYQWRFVPTSGAYQVTPENIDKGRAVTLTRVKNWWAQDRKFWRHRFNPERIRLTVIRDSSKAFEAFRKGDIDFFGLAMAEYWYDKLPDSAPEVRDGYIHKTKFFNDIPHPTYGMWMNKSRPLLDNRDIRVGIQFALNWDLVIRKFSRGDWTRMQTASDGFGEFTAPDVHARGFSVDEALASFAKAGFTKRGPDGILVNDAGTRLSLQITTGYDNLKDVLTILQEDAIKAGLELRVEVLDNTTAFKKGLEKKHDIKFSAWNVSPEMFPRYWETNHSANAYDDAFLPDGSVNPDRKLKTQTNNLQAMADPALDRMIEAYDKSDDIAEMKELAFKIERFLYDDASFSPGFDITFLRSGVWRWIGMPAESNVKLATTFYEYSLYWIDEDLKRETKAAISAGKTFPPGIRVFDQYRQH